MNSTDLIVVEERRPDSPPLLDDLLTRFFLVRVDIKSEATRQHYRRAVRWLGEMLGRRATIADLCDEYLGALGRWLGETRKQTATTANGSHKCLCCLWRWARDKGFLRTGPTVPRQKVPKRIPRAFTVEQIGKLIAAAAAAPGSICGRPAREWWLTLLALEMDTGCRAGELLALRWEWLDWDTGYLTVPAEVRKGQHHDEVYGLLDDTKAWLAKSRKPSGLILGWLCHRSRYYQLWRDLTERAGLPTGRGWKTQCLRRTFATLLEVHGGNATLALGHADRATTLNSYLDRTALGVTRHAEVIPMRVLEIAQRSG